MTIYENNDIKNPKYLFHGSPKLLETIEPRQSSDSGNNHDNEDYAVFLTSSFLMASAYAFKDTIKERSNGLDWNFTIGYDSDSKEAVIKMDNVNIDDDIEGYVYVFPFDEKYDHTKGSTQYKCHDSIKPIDVVKIRFADYKNYYTINNGVQRTHNIWYNN